VWDIALDYDWRNLTHQIGPQAPGSNRPVACNPAITPPIDHLSPRSSPRTAAACFALTRGRGLSPVLATSHNPLSQ
jgi:hypothetical protein